MSLINGICRMRKVSKGKNEIKLCTIFSTNATQFSKTECYLLSPLHCICHNDGEDLPILSSFKQICAKGWWSPEHTYIVGDSHGRKSEICKGLKKRLRTKGMLG